MPEFIGGKRERKKRCWGYFEDPKTTCVTKRSRGCRDKTNSTMK